MIAAGSFVWLLELPVNFSYWEFAIALLVNGIGMGVFAAAVIGILAGWLADLVLAQRHSLFIKLLIGVVGSFIGAFVASRVDLHLAGFLGELVVSSVGAILFLAVLGLIRRPA